MPRKRARRATEELFSRTIQVSSAQVFVWAHVVTTGGVNPRTDTSPVQKLIGTLDEAIRDVHEVTTLVYPDENGSGPDGVGFITCDQTSR